MRATKEQIPEIESKLIGMGYRKFMEGHQGEDYSFFKSFDVTKDEYDEKIIGYQVGFSFYDYTKYPNYVGEAIGMKR